MKFPILIVKNKINYNIDFSIIKTLEFFENRTPLKFDIQTMETNFDLKYKLNPYWASKQYWEVDGIKDKLRDYGMPTDKKIIIFIYDRTLDIDKVLPAYTFAKPLNNAVFIECPAMPSWQPSELYRVLTHEIIHAFHRILTWKGIPTLDTMDFYEKEYEVEATDGNRAQNLKILSPYWEQIDGEDKYKYFSPKEIIGLKSELVKKLDSARGMAGIPFIITSGYRTKETNDEVGGVENSAHLSGFAVDLKCDDSSKRYKIIKALLMSDFNRIGIGKDFIHCDIDKTKPKEVVWVYYK